MKVAIICIAMFCSGQFAHAQTWDGAGADNLWSNGGASGNWTGAAAPVNDGTADVFFGGSTQLTPDMDANWNILSLTFNSGAGAFTLSSTGAFTLTIQGGGITNSSTSTETINNAITLGAAQTWSATSGALSFGGNIDNGGFLLTIGGSSNTSASGIISGTGGLTKSGTGTLTLSGANSYSGATTVSAGILNIQNATGLGTIAAGTTVTSGAALQLQGGITVGAETLTLDGTGISSDGALRNISGNNSWAGTITIDSTTRINSDSGTLTLNVASGNAITGSNDNLQIGGAGNVTINDAIATGSGTLTKDGTGTLILTAANTYTGATTVSAGVLNIQNATGLGTIAAGTTVTSGAALQLQGGITVGAETLTLDGTGISSNGALRNISGNNSWAGTITINSTTRINSDSGTLTLNVASGNAITGSDDNLQIGGAGNVTISDAIATGSGTLTKDGAGVLTLSAANTFSGGLTLNAGIVSISSDANLGASSGSLTFNGGAIYATNNVVSARAIIMTGAGIFYTTFGRTLEESGAISGNGNLTTANSGTLILSGSGSNGTGTTTVSGASLSLRGTVSLGSGVLTLSGGLLELGNGNFTRALGAGAGQVNMNSGSGAGFSAFGADRTVNLGGSGATVTWAVGNFVANAQPLYLGTPTADHMIDFQNPIDLNGASRTITVTDGVGTGIDAKLSGVISGAGASNFVMSTVGFAPWNPGSLLLSNGNNSYAGTTTIIAGTLLLGANATGTAGNTVLGSGATDVLVGFTSSSLNAGLLTNGAFTISRNIRAQSGNTGTMSIGGYTADASTFSGNIFLGTNSVATGKGVTLTAASGGTVTFSGAIQDATGVTTPGVVTKSGAGTVVLSGANTYSGATTVNAGSLFVNGSTASGSAVTVNNSGTTLGGSGTINGSVNVASSGANLAPGESGIGSTAILRTGALTLASGSNLNVDLNNTTPGTGHDQAIVTGAVSITSSNLVVTVGSGLNVNDTFFVLLNDGTDLIDGTFAQGATVTSGGNIFLINYLDNGDGGVLGNDISLTVTAVPEPATWIGGALAVGLLTWSQLRKRSRAGRRRVLGNWEE